MENYLEAHITRKVLLISARQIITVTVSVRRPGGMPLFSLLTLACSAGFPTYCGTGCWRVALPTVSCTLPDESLNQENAPQTFLQTNLMEAFSQMMLPLPRRPWLSTPWNQGFFSLKKWKLNTSKTNEPTHRRGKRTCENDKRVKWKPAYWKWICLSVLRIPARQDWLRKVH